MSPSKLESNLKRKLRRHIDAIAGSDHDVAKGLDSVGYPSPRVRAAGFETLLSIIVSQQISTGAAQAIWRRLVSMLPELDAAALLDCDPRDLRSAGLSGRKVEYATGLAQSIVAGQFEPDRLENLDDEAAISEITSLRGFGRWSAEIYLMFSLQRADIFPADDLALQVALQKLKQLPERPTAKRAREVTARWRPRRSAASLFLWHYYRGAPA